MRSWLNDLQRGIDNLSRHKPGKALNYLQRALKDCPPANTQELSRIFFYLGITLKKLGLKDSALKSWNAGRKIKKRGYSDKMLQRFTNGYGMAKQETDEKNDWHAFFSIHLERYLLSKKSRRLGSEPEKDMIRELIHDHWVELRKTEILAGKSDEEKLKIFKKVKIVFPFFVIPESFLSPDICEGFTIPVDFSGKRRLSYYDRCICGSGLPYFKCCGRTPGVGELVNGLF